VTRIRPFLRAHWADALIVLIALDAVLEVLVREGADAPRSSAWFAAPAAMAIVLPLLARNRFAFAAPAAVWLLATAVSFADGRLVSFGFGVLLGGMAAAYLLGNQRDERQARLGLAIVLASALIIVGNDPGHVGGQYLFVPAQFGICWIAGYALRERAARVEAAEASARVAVAEERTRIARELHDVVAHAVSVMVLQVGAVRHRLPAELAEDTEALRRVEHAGRTALTEMRALLDSMRQEGEAAELGPQPRLSEVEALLGDVRRAGLEVELHVEGTPAELPGAIELSVYRIIQEGLTNTLKHARASRADVVIRYGADQLEVEVTDDGRATGNGSDPGYGLVGVGERVKIYGGEMSAGRRPDGGFTLRTRLPVRGVAT
jgi:signal transduction histidine kinase